MVNWNNIAEAFSDLFRDLHKLQEGNISYDGLKDSSLKDSIDKLEAILSNNFGNEPFHKLWMLLIG